MRMKRFFCMVLACIAVVGCLSVNAGAVETVEAETSAVIARATNRFSTDIPGDSLYTDEQIIPIGGRRDHHDQRDLHAAVGQRGLWLHRTGWAVLLGQRKKRQCGSDDPGQPARELYAGDQKQFVQYRQRVWVRELLIGR